IGYPAPNKMNTGGVHGAALGDDEVAATKEILGFDPAVNFHIDEEVIAHTRKLADRGEEKKAAWQQKFDAWASANPENKALFDRLAARELPEGFAEDLPSWDADPKGVATRKASEAAIQALQLSCRKCGVAPLTLQVLTTRSSRVHRPLAQSLSPPTCGLRIRTPAGTCTSVSVSTRWLQS